MLCTGTTPWASAAALTLALGARDERMLELPRRGHRAGGDRAMVRTDEIEEAEIERCDAGQGGDGPRIVHGALASRSAR